MRLIALRHGQASFGSDDYDQLSPLGAQQCEQAGRWLARHGHDFTRVVRGGHRRHQQSLAALDLRLHDLEISPTQRLVEARTDPQVLGLVANLQGLLAAEEGRQSEDRGERAAGHSRR